MQVKQTFLKPAIILRYLISNHDETDTLIMCKSSEIELVTTDYDIHCALGSLKPDDKLNINKLRKLFEVTNIVSYRFNNKKEKPVLTEKKVEEIRKQALKKNTEGGGEH